MDTTIQIALLAFVPAAVISALLLWRTVPNSQHTETATNAVFPIGVATIVWCLYGWWESVSGPLPDRVSLLGPDMMLPVAVIATGWACWAWLKCCQPGLETQESN